MKDPQSKRYQPEYSSWRAARHRCSSSANPSWSRYGGRGIRMCDRWIDSYESFLADMGPRPEGTSLDRIDPDGHYEPGNCRWATAETQQRNQRGRMSVDTAMFAAAWIDDGFSNSEIADALGVSRSSIANIRYGQTALPCVLRKAATP